MFSNLQISRTLVGKRTTTMSSTNKTVSTEAMELEWQEIQAAQKNPAMFRPLYNRYFENIFRYIDRRVANPTVSADICSQVFMKAMQRLDRYQFKGVPFSAWLFRIASNEITQHHRNNQKNRVVSLQEHNINDIADEMEVPDKEGLQKAMITALDDLKESDIQLIELRFFEQRPFKEIADILGITESNAKVKTYRILDRLKKKLKKEF